MQKAFRKFKILTRKGRKEEKAMAIDNIDRTALTITTNQPSNIFIGIKCKAKYVSEEEISQIGNAV